MSPTRLLTITRCKTLAHPRPSLGTFIGNAAHPPPDLHCHLATLPVLSHPARQWLDDLAARSVVLDYQMPPQRHFSHSLSPSTLGAPSASARQAALSRTTYTTLHLRRAQRTSIQLHYNTASRRAQASSPSEARIQPRATTPAYSRPKPSSRLGAFSTLTPVRRLYPHVRTWPPRRQASRAGHLASSSTSSSTASRTLSAPQTTPRRHPTHASRTGGTNPSSRSRRSAKPAWPPTSRGGRHQAPQG